MVLSLATAFVDAVDPRSAQPQLLADFSELAEARRNWPVFLTNSPEANKSEFAKLEALPLGRKCGGTRPSKAERVVGKLVAYYFRQLTCLAETPHCSAIDKDGRRVITKPRHGDRLYLDYHYICQSAPPLDRRPENAAVWKKVAEQMLDYDHGTAIDRIKARRKQLEGLAMNPRLLMKSSGLVRMWYEHMNAKEKDKDLIEHRMKLLGRYDRRLAHRFDRMHGPRAPTSRALYSMELFPCILALPGVRKHVDNMKAPKSDIAKYNQLRSEICRAIVAKLPAPLAIGGVAARPEQAKTP